MKCATSSRCAAETQDATSRTQPSPENGLANRLGNAGMVKLMRARDQQQSARHCPEVRSVDARVDQGRERWKVLEDHGATFAFSGWAGARGCTNVEYEWSFGDGTKSSDLATTHTYTQPGEFVATLSARCADCPDSAELVDSVKVVALRVDHVAVSDRVYDRHRMELGPGEQVMVLVHPMQLELTVRAADAGTIVPQAAGRHDFTAPGRAGRSTVLIEGPALNPYALPFVVYPPNRITMDVIGAFGLGDDTVGISLKTQQQIEATDGDGRPKKVSFENIEVASQSAQAEDLTGYFATLASQWIYKSYASSWTTVGPYNLLDDLDTIEIAGPQFEQPPLWTEGSFICVRPWRYRVKNDPIEYELTSTALYVNTDGPERGRKAGTMTVSEEGYCSSRSPDDDYLPCV